MNTSNSYELHLPNIKKPSDVLGRAIKSVKLLSSMYKSFYYEPTVWCVVVYRKGKPSECSACLAGALIATSSNYKFPDILLPGDVGYTHGGFYEANATPETFSNGSLLRVVNYLRLKEIKGAVRYWNKNKHRESFNSQQLEWPITSKETRSLIRNLPKVDEDTLEGAITLYEYYKSRGI